MGGTGDWKGRTIVEGTPATSAARLPVKEAVARMNTACTHRGDIVKPKSGCGTQDVYACAKHGSCTRGPCLNYKDCLNCGDYQPHE